MVRKPGVTMPVHDIAYDTFVLEWLVCEPSIDESLLLFYNNIRKPPLVNLYSKIRLV